MRENLPSDLMIDQAEKLRQMMLKKRLLTFVSSRVGLGHSTILANLAIALAEDIDKKLLIIEMRERHEHNNVHTIYNIIGANPVYSFTRVLLDEIPFEKAIVKGKYENINILVSKKDTKACAENIVSQRVKNSVDKLCGLFDLFIVDVGPIYTAESIERVILTNDLITIVTPSNNARTDCYAMLKSIIESNEDKREIKLITNLVTDDNQAEEVNNGIISAVKRFLNADIEILGSIPVDINVIETTREYTPFISLHPETPASVAVYAIAKKLKDAKNNITIAELKTILTKLFTLS